MSVSRRHGGFTYLSLIILVAIIALVAAATLKIGSVVQRSKAEDALLDIGAEFSDALKSYADATPAGMPPQPPSLKELLRDPRFPGTRRHLRKVFVDPMTGKAEWGIIYLGDKTGVLAIYSLSNAKPIKIGNFPLRFAGFEGKDHISDWKFNMGAEAPRTVETAPKPPAAPQSVPALQQAPAPPVVAPAIAPVDAPEKDENAVPAPAEPVSPSEKAPDEESPAAAVRPEPEQK